MAITVKDIQEKIFATQAVNGYDIEQVDDFLDEIAAQLGALIRENLELKAQLDKAEVELAAKENVKAPDYNEDDYFKNLQSTMRDTLISAQRVADDTIASAKAEAERVLTKAQTDAAAMTERAQGAAAAAKEEYESLKAAAEGYRASFRKLVEDQLQALQANDLLFK